MTEVAKRPGVHFQLRPFASGPLADELSLLGVVARTTDTLLLKYTLQGSLQDIDTSSNFPLNSRCHELWRHTCFELFFGRRGESAYWEVNLSLSGCWNIYRFDDYRTGMRPQNIVGPPSCRVDTETDLLTLVCALNLKGIIDESSQLEVGVGSVIEAIDGSFSYWALEHHGTAPDFHNRRSFQLCL